VVFLQHGLMDSSATWVLAGPDNHAPAFRLAEEGYDVWLGNFRGNLYSRAHSEYDPDYSREFWEFTWDEMARYDLPSMLDYVLSTTGRNKLYYVGHSMGTTTFMAMDSLDPVWADKVEVAIMLAPVAYVDHMASPIKLLTPALPFVSFMVDFIGRGEFLRNSWLTDTFANIACRENALLRMCDNVAFLATGFNPNQLNRTLMTTLGNHIPAGTSAYTILHFAQGIATKSFGAYNWRNEERNKKHHNVTTPPTYKLQNASVKTVLFWGDNDWLAHQTDVQRIVTEHPNIVESYQVPCHGWNHMDFLYAIDVKTYQNDHLVETLRKYPIQ